MSVKERNVVLQSRDGGEDTIDYPITRLGNIESGAEVKEAPAQGDYVPLIDGADNEQMKKFPAQWLLEHGGSGSGGGGGTVGTLDMTKSGIGEHLFTAWTGSSNTFPEADEEGVTALKIDVTDRCLRKEKGTDAYTLTGVKLWAAAEASGVPRVARIQVEGQEKTWVGKSWDEVSGRWAEVPITMDRFSGYPCGVLRFQVTSEDGATVTKYAVQVQKIENEIRKVTYTTANRQAEPQYEADGVTPLTLDAEEAEKRYAAMGDLQAELDPTLSVTSPAALSEWERARYFDEEGKPIRRQVYKGWLPNGTNNGIRSTSTKVTVNASNARSVVFIYKMDATKPSKKNRPPLYEYSASFSSGDRTDTKSLTKPLILVRNTDAWDKICVRTYFQVQGEDGVMTYGVLELYNVVLGNCKLGRVELEEDGTLKKDPKARPVVTKIRVNNRPLEWENWNGAALKEIGSAVDRERDRFAVWAYDKDLPFQDGLLPNVLVEEGSWAETPRTDPDTGEELGDEIIDADHADPINLTAWVSPESEKAEVYARTEDPRSWISVCVVSESGSMNFPNHQQTTMQFSSEITKVYDEADPTQEIFNERTERRYGFLAELDQTVNPGESCAKVAFHVKSQGQFNGLESYMNSGRVYNLDLKKGYAARDLVGAEALGEDLTVQQAGTVDQEALTAAVAHTKGWGWVKLTAPAAADGDEPPILHVFRPNAKGQFVRDEKYLMTVYGAGTDGSAPELTKPRKTAAGSCWVKLYCPGTYHVVVTSQNGLWDKWGKEYTLTLTEQA